MKATINISVLTTLVLLIVISSYTMASEATQSSSIEDENKQVIDNMKAGGFDFSRPHVVDFFALFATNKQADTVAGIYRKEYKNIKHVKLIEIKKDENGDHELLVKILMDVSYDNINNFEEKLSARAIANKGKFNGWAVFQ